MGLLLYFRKYITVLIWIQILQIAKTQDRNKYIFGPTASTDYETSLTSFQNNRQGFLPSGIGSPNSYQDKFYYFGNNGDRGFQPSSRFQPSTRSPFELPPSRPFGQPKSFSSSFSRPFTTNTGPGFQPSRNQKTNVPHQQNEFLSQFNDQIQQQHSTDLPPSPKLSTPSSNGNLRFGSNRVRFRENSNSNSPSTTSTSVATASSQQQLPFRNFRSRFQSSSERVTFTTPSSSSTTLTTDKPVVRFNRFGGRSNQPFNPRSTTTTTVRPSPNVSISPPSPSKQFNFTKKTFSPKRPPFFTSRESNLPAHLFKPTSTTEEVIESKSQSPVTSDFKFSSTGKPADERRQEEHTVILTENFFLPGGGILREDDLPAKTTVESEYDDYENDYDDESTYPPTTLEFLQSSGDKENHTITTESEKSPPTTTSLSDDEVYEYVEEEYDDEEVTLTTEKVPTTTVKNNITTPKDDDLVKNETVNQSTESYVVVASIQTSRSINGARFLPFPAIEQEEKKQTLSELEKKIHEQRNKKDREEESSSSAPVVSSTTPTTTTKLEDERPTRNYNISRSFKSGAPEQEFTKGKDSINKIKAVESFENLLPKNYNQEVTSTTTEKSLFGSLIFKEDEIDPALLPPGFKPTPESPPSTTTTTTSTTTTTKETTTTTKETTKATQPTIIKKLDSLFSEDKIDPALLPPGFKIKPSTAEKLSPIFKEDEIDPALLPPGFKPTEETTTTTTKKPVGLLFKEDEIDPALLPPGFKAKFGGSPKSTTSTTTTTTTTTSTEEPTTKTTSRFFKEESIDPALLPPGFKQKLGYKAKKVEKENKMEEPSTTTTTTTTTESSFKLIFPKGISPRKPGLKKVESVSVSKTVSEVKGGPPPPQITIRKGPPVRATTEFTGWPTTSTTPIPIDFEELLKRSKNIGLAFGDEESSSTTTTTEPTTTTTSTEPPKPTKPGHCIDECDLAGTIRIVDGVKWKPELLDHNTLEWKNLAKEVETQLNEIYSGSGKLKKWYRKVRIDSFSKGSVLVDYFVELQNITRDVSTLEIKQLFHDSLTVIPKPVIPIANAEDVVSEAMNEHYMLGRFVVDPVATDFIVIPRTVTASSEFEEEDVFLPQWATALIVVGVGSLFFVILFGVAVLINRQRRAKKTPTPLTQDMLNELNKDHMGGVDNYGADDFYNLDDTWNDSKPPIKSKRFSNNSFHDSNSSYDSWRSVERQPPPPIPDYYHSSSKNYRHHQPAPQLRSHHYQQKFNPYMQQYDAFDDDPRQYSRSRYQRDYGPDF